MISASSNRQCTDSFKDGYLKSTCPLRRSLHMHKYFWMIETPQGKTQEKSRLKAKSPANVPFKQVLVWISW
jgi:hypothetical protein